MHLSWPPLNRPSGAANLDAWPKRVRLNAAVDRIHAAYGRASVVPADLVLGDGQAKGRTWARESVTESLDARRQRG